VIAPLAPSAGTRPEILRLRRPPDRRPQRHERALEARELLRIRLVGQRVGVGQVDQPKLAGHDAARAPQDEGIELHLKQRLGLERLARRCTRLVVDHAKVTCCRDVEPVDVAAQPHAVDDHLDELFARGRFEPARILQAEVVVEQRPRRGQPLGDRRGGVVADREQLRHLRSLGEHALPDLRNELPGDRRGPPGGRPIEQLLQDGVHERAASGARRWSLR
jgi:hypothetical protein